MKLFKKLFVFLLVLPLAFSFVGCGGKDDETGTDTPSQEQPITPTDTSNVFYVSYDYDLPDDYKFLLNNPTTQSAEVGNNVTCPSVEDDGLTDYFLGWYTSAGDKKTAVSGSKGEEISLTGRWDMDSLKKYYYSAGLVFETAGETALVAEYTGSSGSVVIPEFYKVGQDEYRVNAIGDSVFESKPLGKLINHAKDYSIGNNTFKNADLVGYDFTEVTSIGSNAFENCDRIQKIVLPENVVTIGDNVFAGCTGVTEIETARLYNELNRNMGFHGYVGDIRASVKTVKLIGEIIENIPGQYFENWAALESIELNETVESIAKYAFKGCVKLEEIAGLEDINPETFSKDAISDTSYFKNLTEPMILQDVLVLAPNNVNAVISIREGVTKIQKDAFALNTSIKEITIPSTVVSIGDGAFRRCLNLEKVTFATNSNLTTLGTEVFAYCGKLSTIDLSKLTVLETISSRAFEAINISNFVIPSTVEVIASTAFYNASISSFELSGESAVFEVEDGVLYSIEAQKKTLVSYPKLKTGSMFVVPEDVTNFGEFAFFNNSNLQWIYVGQDELVFDSSYVFEGAAYDILIMAESDKIMSPAFLNKVYYLVTENYIPSVDLNGATIALTEDFEPIEDAYDYFVKIEIPGDTVTYRYFIFSIVIEGENEGQVVSVDNDSVVEVTDYFA